MPKQASARIAEKRAPQRMKAGLKGKSAPGTKRTKTTAKRTSTAKRNRNGIGPSAARSVKARTSTGKRNGSSRQTSPPAAVQARAQAAPIVPTAVADLMEVDTGAAASRGKYVYCIIEANDQLRFGPIGIGLDPSEVYSVHYRNLAAVVSDAPLGVIDSTRENVLAHERVNETVMREHTVIPMSFGTIFKTREDIVELLRSAAEAFGDVLNKMQNKLEFGLKVLWDREQAIRELENDDEDIGRLKKEISSQKGPTYFARMQYGRLVDAALQARSERYVSEVLDELRDVSVASRINKPIGDKMIMNVAFLISRDREDAFDAKVKSVASRFDRLTFKYTGPWPPYNFVNIRLKLERA